MTRSSLCGTSEAEEYEEPYTGESVEEFIPIVAIISFAAVAIFRPITKRLGEVLLLHARSRHERPPRAAVDPTDTERIRGAIAGLEQRLDLFEQRLDFTEALVERRGPRGSLAASSEEPDRQ